MPTRYYLTTTAAPYTPATLRGAWDQTAGAVTKALVANKEFGGAITSVAIAETNVSTTFDVLLGRWVSGPMAAQTTSGTINVVLGILESNASADMNWHLHVYATQGDSDTPRGNLLADYTETAGVNEWPTTATFKALNTAQALSGVILTAGDRIVVEIGYISREASATSRTGTLRYGTLNGDSQPYADGAAAGTDVTLKAGYIDFSVALVEDPSLAVRMSQAPLESVAGPITGTARVSQAVVEVARQNIAAVPADTTFVRISQAPIEIVHQNVAMAPPCVGGGVVATGTNPAAGSSLCGGVTPIAWIVVQTDSGEKVYSTLDIAIDGTFREKRVLSLGTISRAFSDTRGGFETARMRVLLADTDRVLRGFADTGTLFNKRVDVYVSTAALIRAGSTPWRVAQMIIRDYDAIGDLTFELQLEEFFGAIVGEIGTKKKTPSRLFGRTDFPLLSDNYLGKPIPIGYGSLSDEQDGSSAVGVVPCTPTGVRTVGGIAYEEFVVFEHAIAGIQSLFGSDLAPTPARVKLSNTILNSEMLVPGRTAWSSAFGTQNYRDFNGRRHTVFYVLATSQRAIQAKNGQVPFALNCCGIEEIGDCTGPIIESLARQTEHLITQFMLLDYQGGNWAAIPTVSSPAYARVRSTSYETVKTAADARIGGGYPGAWMLGWDGSQQTFVDVIQEAARCGDFDVANNRHGQIMASMIDSSAATVKAFTDVTDVIKRSFKAKRRFNELANSIRYRHSRRYVAPITRMTPAEGERLPGELPTDSTDWLSGLLTVSDATSITNLQETRTQDLDLPMVRSVTVADSVAAKNLARMKNGPVIASIETDLCGTDVELGDKFTLTHFAGLTGTGWTARPIRCERHELNLDQMTVLLEGRDLTGL